MRITPVAPVYQVNKETKRNRAFMIIHHEEHEVVDTVTNQRFRLPIDQAWQELDRINKIDTLV